MIQYGLMREISHNPGRTRQSSIGNTCLLHGLCPAAAPGRIAGVSCFHRRSRAAGVRLFRRMAYIGPRLRELQIIPYIDHTYA